MKFDRALLGLLPQLEQQFARIFQLPGWPIDLEGKVACAWEQFCARHPKLNPLSVRFVYKVRAEQLDFTVVLEPHEAMLGIDVRWAKPGRPSEGNGHVGVFPSGGPVRRRRNYYDSDLRVPDTLPEGW